MNTDFLRFDPWALTSLEVHEVNQLPHEPGIFVVYRKRRVLYVGADSKSIRNGWFKLQPSRFLNRLDKVSIGYQSMPPAKLAELQSLQKALIDNYDPQFNGSTQKSLTECYTTVKKLKAENITLKALIKKERSMHEIALCQAKVYLVSKLLSDMEASLNSSENIEEWMQRDNTQNSARAILSVLEEIENVMTPYSNQSQNQV
ncbi:hypothetical protein C8255_11030 [filamentous cyanobacterium CCP3]|nr:hypothetical protein C8255_11030 [filamentous cyanobacterium CCP3]